MNNLLEPLGRSNAGLPVPEMIWPALRELLRSPAFAKAPRMCHLLSFLVEEKLAGREHGLSEYAIGLNVFRRDARLYVTGLDPVVRVQIGRLRDRLNAYYDAQSQSGVRIMLPLGTYVPLFKLGCEVPAPSPRHEIELASLRNLTGQHGSDVFVAGMEEELGSRLCQVFGSLVQPGAAAHAESLPVQRLEGSIRIERGHVRVSMRLTDLDAGRIDWHAQFDGIGELGMRLQEQLAGAICDRLQRHLSTRP